MRLLARLLLAQWLHLLCLLHFTPRIDIFLLFQLVFFVARRILGGFLLFPQLLDVPDQQIVEYTPNLLALRQINFADVARVVLLLALRCFCLFVNQFLNNRLNLRRAKNLHLRVGVNLKLIILG